MNTKLTKALLIAGVITLPFIGTPAFAATQAELEQRVESLNKQLTELKEILMQQAQAQKTTQAEVQKVKAAAETNVATTAVANTSAINPSLLNLSFGGYGEANYNRYKDDSANGSQASLRRFVMFFGNKFNDKLSFNSEIEWENAVLSPDEGGNGETSIEQAYLEYKFNDKLRSRAGLQILPIGFTNTNHEPPVFHGVERNEVETRIIPTTWRELAVSVTGDTDMGLQYQLGLSTTPDASRFITDDAAQYGVKDMRTLGSLAAASNIGYFAALSYRGIPGLNVGGSLFSGDTGHDGKGQNPTTLLKGVKAHLNLWELHGQYNYKALELKGLYAKGTLGDADKINQAAEAKLGTGLYSLGSNASAASEFYGWYTQAAYKLWSKGDMALTPFIRYERYNTQSKVPVGYTNDPINDERVITTGLTFNLHPQVVLKADYQQYRTDKDKNRLNLGVGYMF